MKRLCELLEEKRYGAGESVFEEGDPPGSFYIIKSGRVRILKSNEGKEPTVLATLGSAMFFGEMGPLRHKSRGATVEVVGGAVLLELSMTNFHAFVSEYSIFSMQLRAIISRRMSENLTIRKPADD